MLWMLSKIAEDSLTSKAVEKTNPLSAIDNVWHTSIDAIVNNTTNYVADILDSSWRSIKNLWNIINPMSYKRNWLKNIIKAPAWAITQWATAVKNLTLWINTWIKTLYREWIQNNVRNIENATLEHIPYVWPFVSKVINYAIAIPNVIPAVIDWLSWYVDKKFDQGNEYVKLEWQDMAKIRMRQKKA